MSTALQICVIAVSSVVVSLCPLRAAVAHTSFQREFLKVYTKGEGVDKDFCQLARKAKCYLCHQGKEDRKNYNSYGLALTAYLTEDDKKDKEKIGAALRTVADESSDPSKSDAPTFGQLITEGKLPGGPLEESKKEPECLGEG